MKFSRRSAPVCLVFITILILALPQLTAASSPFSQNLQLRDMGDDVTRLQQLLNAQNYLVTQFGPGSPGNETTTFGLLTYQALTRFQSAHGLPATGYLGPLTRAFISTLAASSTATSTPPSSVGTSTAAVPQLPAVLPFSPLSSTTSGYIPGATPLPGYKPGQLIFIGGGAPAPATPPASPPSPAPYVAKAVHFDGSNYLGINSLTSPDSLNGAFSFSFWYKMYSSPIIPNQGPIFTSDPAGDELIWYGNQTGQTTPIGTNFGAFPYAWAKASTLSPSLDAWHHMLGTIISNPNNNDAAFLKVYVDGVDVTSELPLTFFGDPHYFLLPMNGRTFYVAAGPNFNDFLVGDLADVWIAPGQSLLDSGDIPEATSRKFSTADNRPVDLGTNGASPTGTAPAVYFSGDATTFSTNKGTGGSFTTTGTLTDADTSPSN